MRARRRFVTNAAMRWFAVGVAGLSIGCVSPSPREAEHHEGAASVALQVVPADVGALVITVVGSRTVSRCFDVTPGVASELALRGLPVGESRFTAEAFGVRCEILAGALPTWTGDPVTVVLTAGTVAMVKLTLRRVGGRASVSIDFVDDAVTPAGWVELGAGIPLLDRFGQPGLLIQPTFADRDQPQLMTALICTQVVPIVPRTCRPATSNNQGATWTLHDAPAFAEIDASDWNWALPTAVRSPARPERIYYGVSGHPWHSPDPKGGLWRSDDHGATWTNNLRAGEPGESGEIKGIIPDPDHPDGVYVSRGYDYGNISRSFDAGATFTLVCGHNNVSKSGSNEICGGGQGWAIDFVAGRIYSKHHFESPGANVALDGSDVRLYPFVGLGADSSPGLSLGLVGIFDVPVRGLRKHGGAGYVRFTADGAHAVYGHDTPGGQLWKTSPDLSSGTALTNVSFGGNRLILVHPTRACSWVVSSGATSLRLTSDCGATWAPYPTETADLTDPAPLVAAVYVPSEAGELLVFQSNGRRWKTSSAGPP